MIEKAGYTADNGGRKGAVKILPRVIHVSEERERPRRDIRGLILNMIFRIRRGGPRMYPSYIRSRVTSVAETTRSNNARRGSSLHVHAHPRVRSCVLTSYLVTLLATPPFLPFRSSFRWVKWPAHCFQATTPSFVDENLWYRCSKLQVGEGKVGKIEVKIGVFFFLFLIQGNIRFDGYISIL